MIQPTPDQLRDALGAYRYTFTNERELQDGLQLVLGCLEWEVEREVRLSARDRPDFMVEGVAVEVKVDGGLSEVTRQIHRYAHLEAVRGVLLVTSRSRLANLPAAVNGKPVAVLSLLGGLR